MYKYVMSVTELVESTYVIRSKEKLTYAQLEKRTEAARVRGRLSLRGVSDVGIFCSEASAGGRPDGTAIART